MFDKFIIFFFWFFLTSRFFSEKLKILPKSLDVINYPLCLLLLIFLGFSIKNRKVKISDETKFILWSFFIVTLTFILSILFNSRRILPEGTLLFYIGFMEGPILYLALDKLTKNTEKLLNNINRIFLYLLVINLILIFFVDIPVFLISNNPDVISGTYGNGTYQFSLLLVICGGYLLGYNYIKKSKLWVTILSQILILFVFYLSQFRSGLPFFLVAYFFMLLKLYGRKLILRIIPIGIIFIFLFSSIYILTREERAMQGLRFEDWIEIITDPSKFMQFGKFQIYGNALNMWKDYPETFVIGTGPGNFLSRANYTFTYELKRTDKGVGAVISQVFNINYPYFTDVHLKYVYHSIKPEAVLGTWQFSNPYTSYLSGITEIGIIGGSIIILLYIYLIRKSFRYFNTISIKADSKFLPLSVALIGSSIYLFGLAFLDNYWETSRVTLPVWLLFWAVKAAAYSKDENEEVTGVEKST